MARQTPKHIKAKVERMNRLMEQIIDLNLQVERWLEANGVEDGFDFTYDHRNSRGYGIDVPESFYEAIDNVLNS